MNSSRGLYVNAAIAYPRVPSLARAIEFEGSRSYRLTCIALILWWIASFYSLMAMYDIEDRLQEAAEATEKGSLPNQLLGISFAILGAFYLPSAIRALRARPEARSLFYLLGAYLLWSGTTILWSDDVALSIRRLGQLILLLIGVLGLGAGFYSQTRERTLTLARHVLYASWIAVAVLITSRLWNQSLSELLNPEWTLKSNTSAQFYIYPVAYAIIAALVVYPTARVKQVVSMLLLGLLLVLLKGRTMIAGTLAAGLLVSSRLAKRALVRTISLFIGLILALMQVDLATGGRTFIYCASWVADSLSSLLPYLTIGNGMDDLLSLDGRVPLWHTLWPYFYDHPFVGYGFGAFWNPARFDDVYAETRWHAVAAHNGFLDELLGTGVIGLLLILAFWFASMRLNLRVLSEDRRAGYLVFGWLLLFLFFNSTGTLLQGYSQSPTLFSLTALFAVLVPPARHSIREYRPR
jgi:O-antigen ligase